MHRSRLYALVAAEAAACGVLLASTLGRDPLWGDEGATYDATGRSLGDTIRMVREEETNGSLFHLLVKAARDVFGDDEWVMRLPSLLAAVGFVVAAAALANAVAGRRVAVLVGAVVAVHGSTIQYGRDGRTYALFLLLVTLSFLGLVRDREAPSRGSFALWVLAAGLSFYVHLFAALAIAVQAATLLPWFGAAEQRRRRFVGLVAIGILMLPLLLVIAERGELESHFSSPLGPYIVRDVAFTLAGGGWLVTILLGVAFLVAAWHALRAHERVQDLRLLLLWAAAPAAIGIVLSIPERILTPRYVVPSMVPLVLVLCWWAEQARPPRRTALAAGVLGVAMLGGVTQFLHRNEDWRTLTDTMLAEAAPGDGVVFLDDMLVLVVDYYLQDAGLVPPAPEDLDAVVPRTEWGVFHIADWAFEAVSRDEFDCATAGRDRLWVIDRDGVEEFEGRHRMLDFAEARYGPGEVRFEDHTISLLLFEADAPPAPAGSGC